MNFIDQILNQDCIQGMQSLPDGCVNTCVTSPPYYGLRDYGHDGQIGLEDTPDAYVQKIVEVFREVKRVLRDDGTLWLNLGDSYAAQRGGSHQPAETLAGGKSGKTQEGDIVNRDRFDGYNPTRNASAIGLKHKDLVGIPWRVAFALQADGWYLRQDIIWHKPNPMPESVTDRCTKAHEYIFLLSKSPRYYFDSDSIKEEASNTSIARLKRGVSNHHKNINGAPGQTPHSMGKPRNHDPNRDVPTTRNPRSVWTITTKPFKDAHFATYPEDLIVPCILAGCPEGGLVLDPFMGAGTTALVSKKLGRNYVGFELNEEYKKIADKRLNKTLGIFAL